MKNRATASRKQQRGVAAVEFALVAIVFFMLLIGIVEMGRVLFTWNATAEATRYGARVAAVCPPNDPAILTRMQKIMPALKDENVLVCYSDNFTGATGSGACLSTCSVSTCKQVSVSVHDLAISPLIPRPPQEDLPYTKTPWVWSVPPFTTTLPRESMRDEIDGHVNPVCS